MLVFMCSLIKLILSDVVLVGNIMSGSTINLLCFDNFSRSGAYALSLRPSILCLKTFAGPSRHAVQSFL